MLSVFTVNLSGGPRVAHDTLFLERICGKMFSCHSTRNKHFVFFFILWDTGIR